MVVDAHLHLFRAVSDEYPRATFDVMAEAEREELAAGLIAYMDAAGVDKAIVIPLSAHDNYLRDVLAEHAGRFAGVGVFDPDVDDPVADLEHRLGELELQGLQVYRIGDPVDDVETLTIFPLLATMQRHGLKLWFYADPEQLAMLDAILERLPELDIVLNHLGFCPDIHAELRFDEHKRPRFENFPLPPPTLELVEQVARHPRVHVHVSGQYAFSKEDYPHTDVQPVVDAIYRTFGAERMLWASDYPWIVPVPGYVEQLALVDHYLPELSADERDAIRGGTAASLFRF